jgi:RNA polymerase sigma factor (sigma-70 family)
MAGRNLGAVLRHLRRVLDQKQAGAGSDAELLERFVRTRDEAAFELLVWRHRQVVMGVCRRVLGDLHEAEDAFQATFLALARKAHAIGRREALGSWLYRVAYRVALNARSRLAKRATHERHDVDLTAIPSVAEPGHDLERRELWAALDREVNRLPKKLRVPVVLCYLEGKTYAEAGQQLGLPVGTVSARLTRARSLLHARLLRRGLGMSGALLASLLCEQAAMSAAPTGLVDAALKVALSAAGRTGSASAISAEVAFLTHGVLQSMFFSKVKIVLALALAMGATAGAVATGVGMLKSGVSAEPPMRARSEQSVEKASRENPGPKAIARTVPEVLKEALQTAEKEEDPRQKVRCLGWVAKAQHLAGDDAACRTTLEQAAKVVDAMSLDDAHDVADKLQLLRFLARFQADVGEVAAAKKTVQKIRKPPILGVGEKQVAFARDWALADIATCQAQAGKFQEALATAATAGDWKGRAVLGIMTVQAKAKNWKSASELAQTIQDDQQRSEAFLAIARQQSKAGDPHEARKSLDTALQVAMKMPYQNGIYYTGKVMLLSQIAQLLADVGDTQEALRTAESIPADADRRVKEEKQMVLVHVQLRNKDWKKALEIAEQMPQGHGAEPDGRAALQQIAQSQAEAKDFQGAIETLAKRHGFEKVENAVLIARIRLQAGDTKEASQLLQQAAHEAATVAYDRRNDFGKPMLVYQIAFTQTEIGDEKAARAWIAKEPSPYIRTRALLGIIDGLAQREGKEQRVFPRE